MGGSLCPKFNSNKMSLLLLSFDFGVLRRTLSTSGSSSVGPVLDLVHCCSFMNHDNNDSRVR